MLLTIGGCAANTAVDLVKMDVEATVAGRVGGDVFGRLVAEMLRDQGVDVAELKVSPEAETSQTLIVNVVGQDRRFIHSFGANAAFQAGDLPLDRLGDYAVLYVGGYLVMPRLRPKELLPVFAKARQLGVKTVLDVVVPGPGDHLSHLAELLPHVDVFLPNNHEAELIAAEHDPLRQAEFFRRLGVDTVVITMGGEGSVLVRDELRLRAGVFSMPYVDGSGGGDAFAAGYISGLLRRLPPEECLRLASALGASCVRAIGTTPGVFTRRECEEFLRSHDLEIERA
jgi:sugar/nucleoside kinase (ribokinase family)